MREGLSRNLRDLENRRKNINREPIRGSKQILPPLNRGPVHETLILPVGTNQAHILEEIRPGDITAALASCKQNRDDDNKLLFAETACESDELIGTSSRGCHRLVVAPGIKIGHSLSMSQQERNEFLFYLAILPMFQ